MTARRALVVMRYVDGFEPHEIAEGRMTAKHVSVKIIGR